MASRWAWRIAQWAALATGVLARVWNVRDLAAGDEPLSAARLGRAHPLGAVWRTYPAADGSWPLSVLDRPWSVAGQPLDELAPLLLTMLCGLSLLWWLPRAVARRLGDGVGLALCWLLALSPLLVLSSRVACRDAPVAFLGSLAVVSFLRWWLCGNRLAAALYALCAALAVSVHLLAAPFVLAPWLFAAGDLRVRPRTSARPKWRQILVVAGTTAGALVAALVPARDSLAALLAAPGGGAVPSADSFDGLASLWAGTRQPLLLLLFWTAAAVGLALLWTRQRRLAVFSLVLVATQLLGLVVAASCVAGLPVILNRYLVSALPVVLVWVSVALAEAGRLRSGRGARPRDSVVSP